MKPYANLVLHTDVFPYEVVGHTKKTILVREMRATLSSEFTPAILPGGFCGHCVNQREQKWDYSSDLNAPVVRAYLRRDGFYWSRKGRHDLSDIPYRFYDYNF